MALANQFDPLSESRRVINQADELAVALEQLAFEADCGRPFSAQALEAAFNKLVSLRSRCEYLGREVSLLLIAAPLVTEDAGHSDPDQRTSEPLGHFDPMIDREAFGDLLEYCIAVESASHALIGGAR